ncbi:MAG: cytochrome-c peroxidase [Candidatus Sericytochromatia bacterium]
MQGTDRRGASFTRKAVPVLLCLLLLGACRPPGLKPDGSPAFTPEEQQLIFSLSPLPSPPVNPSNRYADDPAAAHLGQYLFYDTRLSANGKLNCASCHNPALGWSDARPVAVGLATGPRNSPALWNVAHQRWLFWDGRADSLWAQAIQPLESAHEMGSSRVALYRRFQQDPQLRKGYETVFGPLPVTSGPLPAEARPVPDQPQHPLHQAWLKLKPADQHAINRFAAQLGKSFEAFERQLLSQEAPFDRFAKGLRSGDARLQTALSADAQKGLRLFIGRGQCILCHTGPALSDGEFHNVGLSALAAATPKQPPDQGRYGGIQKVRQDSLNGLGAFSDLRDPEDPWGDKLRYVELQESNRGEFRTPSLREVARTGPYFHDGRFGTLEQVVAYYSAPQEPAVGRREDTIQALAFEAEEITQLVAFLKALDSGPPAERLTRQPAEPVLKR